MATLPPGEAFAHDARADDDRQQQRRAERLGGQPSAHRERLQRRLQAGRRQVFHVPHVSAPA